MNMLNEAETADFRCLAGMIVPASTKYDVPGADDATIFADAAAIFFGSLSKLNV